MNIAGKLNFARIDRIPWEQFIQHLFSITFRYRKNIRRIEEGLDCPGLIVPPGDQLYTREARQPPIPVPQDMVLFCRRVYDYRGKKLVKNPG